VNDTSPPLSVWICSILIVIIFFGMVSFAVQKKEAYLFHKKLGKIDANKINVIAIGTSLTRYALYPDKVMNSLAKSKGINNLNFIKFSYSGRTLYHFNALFKQMCCHRPDIVFLDTSLVFYRPKSILKARIRDIKYFLRTLVSMPTKPLNRRKQRKTLEDWQKNLQYFHLRKKLSPSLETFLEYAKKHHILVFLLDFTRAQEAQKYFPEKFILHEKKLIKYYQDKYNIQTITFSPQLPASYYYDYAHANPKGQEIISNFFIDQIKQFIKQ